MSAGQSTHMCSGRLLSSIGLLSLRLECCLVVVVVVIWAGVVAAVHLNVVRDTSARHMLAERSISRQWSWKRGVISYFLAVPLYPRGAWVLHGGVDGDKREIDYRRGCHGAFPPLWSGSDGSSRDISIGAASSNTCVLGRARQMSAIAGKPLPKAVLTTQ